MCLQDIKITIFNRYLIIMNVQVIISLKEPPSPNEATNMLLQLEFDL
jgi:hypothetical protein